MPSTRPANAPRTAVFTVLGVVCTAVILNCVS